MLSERGVSSSSMSELAHRAGIARQTLYNYFPDLEHVLLAFVEMDTARAHRRLAEEVARVESAEDKLRVFVLSRLEEYSSQLHRAASFAGDAAGYSPATHDAVRQHVAKVGDILRSVLEDGVAVGAFRSDLDVDLHVEITMRVLVGLQLVLFEGRWSPSRVADSLLRMMLEGISARARPDRGSPANR